MTRRHHFVCGQGRAGPARAKGDPLALDLQGSEANVYLKLEDISEAMAREVPTRLIDLLEIAAYVYSADQAVARGSSTDAGERWRRNLEFSITVRDPCFWETTEVLETLVEVLSFLSDDAYSFRFTKLSNPPSVQRYLELGDDWRVGIERVLLFSGGADSLAGAVQTALLQKESVALVNHRSAPQRAARVRDLISEISRRASPRAVHSVPVWATKAESVGREYTQRTRSFLYASLATTVTAMLSLDRLSFFENGVTSINLPISSQVVGSRATRTTHPRAIRSFSRLFSLILGKAFEVESPFLWHTKTEVLRVAQEAGCADLLAHTVSCTRTVGTTKLHTHCGRCSQCIDRRFAALAAGLSETEDPPEMYKVDLLTGDRAPGEDRTMLQGFVERARLMREMGDVDFFAQFPEATRVLRHTGLETNEAARRVLDLHRRHGAEVGDVLSRGLKENAAAFQAGRLSESCLIVLAVPGRYRSAPEISGKDKGPTFVREGDFWRVSFENENTNLRDSIGVHYIAFLLQSPGYEFHCAELIRVAAGSMPAPNLVWRDPSMDGSLGEKPRAPGGGRGDGAASPGALVDRKTVRACRVELEELEAEIARAHADGRTDRELSLRDDERSIREYVRAATGLEGAPREASDEDEKARKAVANALRRALNNIDKKHASLSRHLRKQVRTGEFCMYAPDPAIRWVVRI